MCLGSLLEQNIKLAILTKNLSLLIFDRFKVLISAKKIAKIALLTKNVTSPIF